MLTTVALVPDHPVCIPDIGGDHIREVEQSVNGMMKLALKLHAEKTDLLVCVSAGLPMLHHRVLLGKGREYVRFFGSNTHPDREIHLQFPGALELYTPLELMISDKKVPAEAYVQESDAIAIDNGLLSFLFYCSSIGFLPQIALVGPSDLSTEKHRAVGRAIGELLNVQENVTSAVILCGSSLAGTTIENGSTWTSDTVFDGTLTNLCPIGYGVLSTWEKADPIKVLGQEDFEGRSFTVGYVRRALG
ncbi:hypothetical protein COW46_03115 [Candidatus Gracilibacteria bacterium CG17_big_fil_post_rev_8_21_14_2_50_48_13]|nr:MAG: hypothetical protein COW46_03115 [Candidatus Gracilibacteria bacterium CG17_big_fil_post_rev_8_21_14_2_50_48_13]